MSSNNAASPSAPKIQIRDLEVSRGGRRVLQIDDLAIAPREVSVIIGPNGSGKSTLLGVLQLLIKPDRGELLLDGRPMRDDPLTTRRRMASVFQEALLLNTTVRKNVETALRLHKVPRSARRARAERWLDRFGVGQLADRHAREISGGEAQRVSLARAFALEPEVLLLDEPFSALDAPTRAALIDDFAHIAEETHVSAVLVTHDRDEALRLGDRIAVLIQGRLRQLGTPGEIFGAPTDEDVAAFVGMENIWPVDLIAHRDGVASYALRASPQHQLEVAVDHAPLRALFAVRPEEITVAPAPLDAQDGTPSSARNQLDAVVRSVQPAGPVVRLALELGRRLELGQDPPLPIVATVTRPSLDDLNLSPGSAVSVTFKATAAHVIAQD